MVENPIIVYGVRMNFAYPLVPTYNPTKQIYYGRKNPNLITATFVMIDHSVLVFVTFDHSVLV